MDTGERIKQIFTMKSTTTESPKNTNVRAFLQCTRITPDGQFPVQYTVCPRYGAWILVRVQMGRSNNDYTAVSTPL